ncbi:MAG: 4Fe-4S binding protein [Thermodesulfobacteriota bacterium]
MGNDIYERLRGFLNTLPTGFPATPKGVELRILKKLFTPEEAELTMNLRSEPEDLPQIAARIGREESELASKLEDMAQKGLIFRVRQGDQVLYQAYQFMVGIYEFQVKNLDSEFSQMFEEYLPYFGISLAPIKTKQLRVIPVNSAIKVLHWVAPYNKIRELVRQQDLISVTECICRKEQKLLGKECDRPKETCLGFGKFARFYLDNKLGRSITIDEAMKILDLAEESGLVLSPSNAQKLEFLCCCCPCCCPILRAAKLVPKSKYVISSYYQAKIDPDLCSDCGLCIERCQVDAIKEGDGRSEIRDEKCIGCGLCVSTCPEEAISLMARQGMEDPPKDFSETLLKIETERRTLQPRS